MSKDSINKIPFGLKDGLMVQVSDVERGLNCDCVCPACGRRLQANKGNKISHYFSHDPSLKTTSCDSAFETSIHLMAKQIISDEGGIAYPQLTVKLTQTDANGASHSDDEIVEEALTKKFREVLLEKRLEDIRPDIIGYGTEGAFLIEVAVTHFSDTNKKKKIRALGLPAIEIDLSSVSYTSTKEELKKLIIEEATNKKWLSNPKVPEIKKIIKTRLDEKIRLINESIYKARSARVERKHNTVPLRKKIYKKNYSLKEKESKEYSNRWFLCEACRYIFDMSNDDVPKNINTVSCPECGYGVSTN